MIAAAMALAIWPSFLSPPESRPVHHFKAGGGWRAERRVDRFTGKTTCTLERGRVTHRGGLVTFHLGRWADTTNAVLRLGDGPPMRAADLRFEASVLGANLRWKSMKNPTGGAVHVPARLLEGVDRVMIRPGEKGNVRRYRVSGLSAAVAAAAERGCRDYDPLDRHVVVIQPEDPTAQVSANESR